MGFEDWVRPEHVKFPTVWYEFEGKKEVNGKKRRFWVQDMTDDYHDEVIENLAGFLRDEPICKYSAYKPEDIKVSQGVWAEMMKQKLTVICLTADENGGRPKMAGFNILIRADDNKTELDLGSEKLNNTIALINYVTHHRNACEHFGMKEYLSAMGLYVLPEFRGQSLGGEILKVRGPICKALGFKCTLTIFTSSVSQKLADRSGFKDFHAISYEDLAKVDKRFYIKNIQEHTIMCRYMYKSFDFDD